MPEYKVGTIRVGDGLGASFLFQSNNLGVESDREEVADENGNVCALQDYNHRAVADMEAVIPRGTALPVPGQTIALKGVTLPTVAADGTVTGTFAIDAAPGSSTVAFRVTSARVSTQNKAVTRMTLQATRWLVNGLPAAAATSP